MKQHAIHLERGFGLVDVMAAIAVAMIVMMVGLKWMASEQRRAIGSDIIVLQTQEFGALTRALADHLNNAPGLPTALDTPFDVAVSDLVTAQRLPSGFGIRMGSSVPVALTGQAYTLRGVKKSDGYRGVVYLEGAPSADVLARAGIEDAGLFWQQVAKRLRAAHLVQAGVLAGAARSFDPNVSGFAYDVSGVVPGTHALSTVVALANYSDLNTIPPVKVDIDPSSLPSSGGGAGTAACTYVTSSQSCPSGTTEALAWQACDARAGVGAASFTGAFGSVALTLTERSFFDLGGGGGSTCTSKYAGIDPYLPRVGTAYQNHYVYGESTDTYGTAWAQQALQSASYFNMGPVAGFPYSTYSENGGSCSSTSASYTGSCAADLANPAYNFQSTYTCAALDADPTWEPMWYSPGSNAKLGTNSTSGYCPYISYNGDTKLRAIGYSRDMVVTWNGSQIARYRGCIYGLPIDGRTGPEQNANWRTKLGIGSTKIQPPCPAEQPRGQTGYTTERWGATKIFTVPQAGGGKLCCS